MITGINESKKLTKHISCKCTCQLKVANVTWIKSGTMTNVGVSTKIWKNTMHTNKIIFGILWHAVVKMVNI